MGRIIELTVDNKVYKLEFNYKSLLKVSDIQDKLKKAKTSYEQFECYEKLIRIAFEKNHPNLTDEEFQKVFSAIGDLKEFTDAILVIIKESVELLNKKQGNAHWEVK